MIARPDFISEKAFEQLRSSRPSEGLKWIELPAEVCDEDERVAVIVRRLDADEWQLVEKHRNSGAAESVNEKICGMAVVYSTITPMTLFRKYPFFQASVAAEVYRFSGLIDPLTGTLPKKQS